MELHVYCSKTVARLFPPLSVAGLHGNGSNMHEDIFARRVKYAQRDTFARRLFCTKGQFCTRGHFCSRFIKK